MSFSTTRFLRIHLLPAILLSLAGACVTAAPRTDALQVAPDEPLPEVPEQSPGDGPELECDGGRIPDIEVEFDCRSVLARSCKDLSNIVIELSDGSRYRYEDLEGHEDVFGVPDGAGSELSIVRVWVKSGPNHSGDGPGYGELFVAPEELDCSEQ